jgi:GH24 family phage-related lysozyme (muramidase)
MALAQTPQIRSQVINRDTTDTTGLRDVAGAGNELAGFADFFRKTSDIAHEKQEKADIRRDEDALLQLDLAAKADPEKAKEAIRTGDYSGFVGQERAARAHFKNAAPTILGRAIGIREAKAFSVEAQSFDPAGDLQQFTREHIRKSTLGMSPRGAAAFATEIERTLPELLRNRNKANADHTRTTTIDNTRTILNSALDEGNFNTYGDVKKMYMAASAAMAGTPALEAQVLLQMTADRELIKRSATETDPGKLARIFSLLNERDAEGDNMTVLERNREDVDKIVNNAVANQVGITTAAFLQFERDFEVGIVAAGSDPAKLRDLSARLIQSAGNYTSHKHPRYVAMQVALVKAVQGSTETNAVVRAWRNGRVAFSTKERDGMIDAARAVGSDEAIDMAAQMGGSAKQVQAISMGLSSGNPDVILASLAEVTAILGHPKAGTHGVTSYIKDKKALAIYTATLGADTDSIRAMLPNLVERLTNFNGEIDGNFGNRFNVNRNVSGVTAKRNARQGIGSYAHFLKTRLKNTDKDELEAMGLVGMGDGNLSNLSPEVISHMVEMLDVASIAAGASSDNNGEQLWGYFKNIAQQDFMMGSESGRPMAYLNKAPRVLVAADGSLRRVAPWTAQSVKDTTADWKRMYGVTVGLIPDSQTEIDGSMLLTFDTDHRTGMPMAFSATTEFSGRVHIPREIAEGPLMLVLGDDEVDESGEYIIARIKKPGDIMEDNPDVSIDGDEGNTLTEEFLVDHRTKLRWNSQARTWEIRGLAGPPLPADSASLEEVEEFAATMSNVLGVTPKVWQAMSPRARREAFAEAGHPSSQTIEELEEQLTVQPSYTPDGQLKTAGSGPQAIVEELNRRRKQISDSRVSDQEHNALQKRQDAADSARALETVRRREVATGVRPLVSNRTGSRFDKSGELPDQSSAIGGRTEGPGIGAAKQFFFSLFGKDRPATPKSSSINSNVPVPSGYGVPGKVPSATAAEQEAAIDDVVTNGVDIGMFSAAAANEGKAALPEDRIQATATASMAGGGYLDDLSQRTSSQFMMDTVTFIRKSEGWKSTVYPDLANGQPTIGFGFSLNRNDAEEALKAAGAPTLKEVKAGKPITIDAAAVLAEYAVTELAVFLKKHFKGVPLAKHQLKALISLGYSSRHKIKPSGLSGPTLIGPLITKAIRAQNWDEAANEIEFNSLGGIKEDILDGMIARRRLEAAMFRGLNAEVE